MRVLLDDPQSPFHSKILEFETQSGQIRLFFTCRADKGQWERRSNQTMLPSSGLMLSLQPLGP